jgi:hypothetical protein
MMQFYSSVSFIKMFRCLVLSMSFVLLELLIPGVCLWAPVAGGAELHSGREEPLGLAEAVLESVRRLVEHRFSILEKRRSWACTLPNLKFWVR